MRADHAAPVNKNSSYRIFFEVIEHLPNMSKNLLGDMPTSEKALNLRQFGFKAFRSKISLSIEILTGICSIKQHFFIWLMSHSYLSSLSF